MTAAVAVLPLGQSGFRFAAAGFVAYVDPYLSDSVAELEGPHLRRLRPVVQAPGSIRDADLVMISHIHQDHCDPATLLPLSQASPQCRFLGPSEVLRRLRDDLGIAPGRLLQATGEWRSLHANFRVRAVPAAHPRLETDAEGHWRCVGFVFDMGGRRIYHSGDCSVDGRIVDVLRELQPIDVAFLPVNECNYYRARLGIIGNMSVREAFGLGTEIGAPVVVPMHYDMFAPNAVYPEEIRVVYENSRPGFQLLFEPRTL